jgi:hypothetical protein
MVMNGLILHVGGRAATLEELGRVELPEKTKSYTPVPHIDLVERAVTVFQKSFDMEVRDMGFGLARDGAQMFGVIRFDADGEMGPAVGLRNSYDKSLRVGIATGGSVFVCDNLCFSGDAYRVLRKHTSNVLEDLDGLILKAAAKALPDYDALAKDIDSFRGIEITDEQAFAALGVLAGRKVITPTQFNAAMNYWLDAPYDEHATRDVYGLYQAVTGGLRKAPPQKTLEAHVQANAFVRDLRDQRLVIDVQSA